MATSADRNVRAPRIPLLKEAKAQLRSDLRRIGVDEMTLYPELEHSCNHLKTLSGLAAG